MLYRIIRNPKEGERVQFLGCHVLRWPNINGNWDKPSVAFVEATRKDLKVALKEKSYSE